MTTAVDARTSIALSKKARFEMPSNTNVTDMGANDTESEPDGSFAVAEAFSEGDAIRKAQAGDAAAFEFLYKMHSRRVYSLCLRMTGDPVGAQDLTQDAFLQLFRKIKSFRGESSFSTWLHRLTVNIVLMKFRKKRHPEVSLDEPAGPDKESEGFELKLGEPDLRIRGTLDRMRLDRAIEQMPDGYRAIFVLHDVQGYAHEEIAQILGCSVGNSKSQLHKARLRMRELLTRRIRRAKRRKSPAKADDLSAAVSGLSLSTIFSRV